MESNDLIAQARERERCGRCYGDLHLAIAFTVGIEVEGDAFKQAKVAAAIEAGWLAGR